MRSRLVLGAAGLAAVAAAALALTRAGRSPERSSVEGATSASAGASDPKASPPSGSEDSPAAVGAATLAPVPASSASADVWAFGSGPRDLGRGTSPEGHPIAPASFLADGDGLMVLDQVNGRIVRSDGTSVRLPGKSADDIARGKDGSLAVLDRKDGKDVAILGPDGRVRGRIPLEGTGIEAARNVSRVVISGSDVLVEQNGGGPLLRIGTTDGKPSKAREEINGIPSRDGTALLSAGITSEDDGRAWVTVASREGEHRWTRELKYPGELSAVGFLDGVGAGAVWVVLLAGATSAEYVNLAVCIDGPTGRVRASLNLAVEAQAWESFRDFAVRDDGSLVAAGRTDQGVAFATYPCPE